MISHYSGSNFFEVILEIFTISLNFLIPKQIRIKAPRKIAQSKFSLDYQNNLKYIISKEDKKYSVIKISILLKTENIEGKESRSSSIFQAPACSSHVITASYQFYDPISFSTIVISIFFIYTYCSIYLILVFTTW